MNKKLPDSVNCSEVERRLGIRMDSITPTIRQTVQSAVSLSLVIAANEARKHSEEAAAAIVALIEEFDEKAMPPLPPTWGEVKRATR